MHEQIIFLKKKGGEDCMNRLQYEVFFRSIKISAYTDTKELLVTETGKAKQKIKIVTTSV